METAYKQFSVVNLSIWNLNRLLLIQVSQRKRTVQESKSAKDNKNDNGDTDINIEKIITVC
jgi:hypothetical protein